MVITAASSAADSAANKAADTDLSDKDHTCMGPCSLLTCQEQQDLDTVAHNRSMGTNHTTRSEQRMLEQQARRRQLIVCSFRLCIFYQAFKMLLLYQKFLLN